MKEKNTENDGKRWKNEMKKTSIIGLSDSTRYEHNANVIYEKKNKNAVLLRAFS